MFKIPVFSNKFAIFASVLGVARTLPNGTTLSSVKNGGSYYAGYNASDSPAGYGILKVYSDKNNYMIKQLFFPDNSDNIHSRYYYGNTWSGWRQL